jgi:membrane-associated phospholipid phosphatase
VCSATQASANPSDSTAALPRSPDTWSAGAASGHPLFTRGDAWFAAATVTSVALATRLDHWAAEEAPENNGAFAVGASHAGERLGNPLYLVPAFLVVRAADAFEHRSDRAASLVRIAEGAVAASAAVSVVKLAVGRARPYQTPGDPGVVRPFSGNASFPSGHTALAFGIAAAIDKETSARWVPYVVYPLAGLVGWSRMRDGEHWSSDVVAGAALGFWTARKAVDFARRRIHAP